MNLPGGLWRAIEHINPFPPQGSGRPGALGDALDKEIEDGFGGALDLGLGDTQRGRWPSMFIRAKP
jgi:hypothetical protein